MGDAVPVAAVRIAGALADLVCLLVEKYPLEALETARKRAYRPPEMGLDPMLG
jgi:hypothetical protein